MKNKDKCWCRSGKLYEDCHKEFDLKLAELKKQGKILAVATSKPTVYSQMICDKYDISPYIDFLSGSELDGRNTNKADVIKIAMVNIQNALEKNNMI